MNVRPVSFFYTSNANEIKKRPTSKTAAGIDEIDGRAFGSVVDLICEQLAYVINKSFTSDNFLDLKLHIRIYSNIKKYKLSAF